VSYSHVDSAYVRALVTKLRGFGFDVWVDDGIDVGSEWITIVRGKVDSCAAFVLVMTPEAERSTWVARELERAETRGKPILPILLHGEPFDSLSMLHYDDVTARQMPSDRFVRRLRSLAPAGPQTPRVFYETPATTKTPAPIIYLLDMSESMNEAVDGATKTELVSQTVLSTLREMVRRSIKGTVPMPRYLVGAFAYNDTVRDIYGGLRPITEIIQIGVPVMKPDQRTNVLPAFEAAEAMLLMEYNELYGGPAPLICHISDGNVNSDGLLAVVDRIRQLAFLDGPVLLENVLVDDHALREPVLDIHAWPGVRSSDELVGTSARELFDLSSTIPASYRRSLADRGYHLQPGARLFFPGGTAEMVDAAIMLSGITPIA
jgi:hypothetical protein